MEKIKISIGYFLKWLGTYLINDDSLATTQEALDRARTCNECLIKGKCVDCGCNFDHMVQVRKPCAKYKPKFKAL